MVLGWSGGAMAQQPPLACEREVQPTLTKIELQRALEALNVDWSSQLNQCYSNPDVTDTDKDGLTDCVEAALPIRNRLALDKRACDSDGDLLGDGEELRGFGEHHSSPWASDTDGDGLTDSLEVSTFGLDPSLPDMPVRTEFVERDTLSLVRGGVPTHRFRLQSGDIAWFSLGLAGARGLRPSADRLPGRGDGLMEWKYDRDEILLGAMQLAPTLIPLETGRGTALRDLGRTIVRAESTMLAQGAGYALARPIGCDRGDRDCAARSGRTAGAVGATTAWTTVLLKSRRQRGLAFDVESLVGVAGSSVLGAVVACEAIEPSTYIVQQQAEMTIGDLDSGRREYRGRCYKAAGVGAAAGFLVPFLHLGGEL